ncbi:hypothetical protein EYF80_022013 [Liparis tanakae]|uniref:Uncharacterized protein n=1 Tax=Liparis tanakae TaxID=230148 RepID=A0A4Z2HPJ4_9TELE|nr:hypothetical protein EYF80_022013 [Liparis tanakae]
MQVDRHMLYPGWNLTAPSLRASVRMLLLSLSATYRQPHGSSGAAARPDGWAKPALWGYELFRFSSLPLPAHRKHVPALDSLPMLGTITFHAPLPVRPQHSPAVPSVTSQGELMGCWGPIAPPSLSVP